MIGHWPSIGQKLWLDHWLVDIHMYPVINAAYDILETHFWIFGTCCCALLVAISAYADKRRNKRVRLEDVGFMPWTGITVFSVLLTTVSIALAIKAELSL
jgi:hypothetical protein